MKKLIYKDDFYPFYDFTDVFTSIAKKVEISKKDIEYYDSVMEEFYKVQGILKELYKNIGR